MKGKRQSVGRRNKMKKLFLFFRAALFLFSLALILTGCKTKSATEEMMAEGIAKFEKTDFEGAEKLFSEIIRIDPENLKAYFKLTSAKVCIDPNLNFIDELNKTIKEKSTLINLVQQPVFFQSGRNAEEIINTYRDREKKLLDISDEISAFGSAIEKNPNNAKLYRGRGEWRFLLGDRREAINDFTKAIRLDNNFDMAFLMCGRCYTGGFMNDTESNYVAFKENFYKYRYYICRAYQVNPKNKMAMTELSAIYYVDKYSNEERLELFSKTISADSTNWVALMYRAGLRIEMKDNKGALQDYEQLVKKFPGDSWYREWLGLHKIRMGMIKEGLNDLRKAQTLSYYEQQIKWLQEEIDKHSKRKK